MRILLLITTITIFAACNKPVKGKNGVTYKDAVAYNDYIVSRQTVLMKNVLAFGKAAELDLDSAENMLREYVKDTERMIVELKDMPPYKGDSTLRDAAVNSFTFYRRVFGDDYMQLLALRKKDTDMTESDIEEMDKIVDKISKEEEGFDKTFHNAQRDFANRNKMKLRENEMQKEIDKLD